MKSRQFPLNPCDSLIFTFQRVLEAQRRSHGSTLMVMETEGDIDPNRLRAALARAMQTHPVTAARVQYTGLRGRPVWVTPEKPADVSAAAFTYQDLRHESDWLKSVHELIQRSYAAPIDVMRGPQGRLDFYRGPEGHGRVCLRWPHELVDGEGAQWLFSEIGRLATGADNELPPALLPDGESFDPLAGRSTLARLRLWWRAYVALRTHQNETCESLIQWPATSVTGLRLRLRVFEPEEHARIKANARRTCPSGPGLYARYLAGCVIRSLHRLYIQYGVNTNTYLIGLPMSIRIPSPRAVPGNYIVWVTLRAGRELMEDPGGLAAELHHQFVSYLEGDMMNANWAMYWVGSKLGSRVCQKLLKDATKTPPCVWGLSYYHEIDPPLRQFAGARVSNLWATHAAPPPAGINPVFARFGDRLNFTLTWLQGYVPEELAEAFAAAVEREAVNGPDSG